MTLTKQRLQLRAAGFAPIPALGKKSYLDDWSQKTNADEEEIARWEKQRSDHRSTGLLTQKMPTLDIDIKNQNGAEAVEALIRKRFEGHGRILVRVGLAPKRAIPFRTEAPFEKIAVNFLAPDGSTSQKLEFLADGQQLVAFGVHPDTHKPYTWHGGEPGQIRLEELPPITEAEALQLVDDATKLLTNFGYQPTKTRPKNDGGEAGSEDWSYLLANIHAGVELHDSTRDLAAKLVVSGMAGGAAVNLLRAAMQESKAPRDIRFTERLKDIPNLVTSAEETFGGTHIDLAGLKANLLQSSAEFVAGFVPPDYLVDGLLQRRYVYSMTAPTGFGKTAIALRIAAHVALGIELAGMEVEQGYVLYFAGENPDDVRTRWIKQCEELGLDPDEMNVVFLPGTPPISNKEIRKRIDAEAAASGPFSLVIIDTSAAYFPCDDENSNAQLAAHARMMRSFVKLPGGPTILVTCHPVKNFDMDNLLPRGGGAFLNEMDGNLVCLKEPGSSVVTLDTHGKFRGPEFEPFSFQLVAGTSEKLKDTKGRLVSTITAEPITQDDKSALEDIGHDRQDQLLLVMKASTGLSLSELAERLGWTYKNGGPNTSLVHRMMLKLVKDRLVTKNRKKHYDLTKKGLAAAEEIEAKPNPVQPFLDRLARKRANAV